MKPVRRQLLRLLAGVAVVPVLSRVASALDYPSQSVRLIVPYAPGGTTDTVARQIGPWLSERLAQAFVIESRPGAGTNVGTDAVAHAAPDGNTLLLFDPSAAINATLYERLNFNFIRDIAPIVCIFRTPLVIVVNPSLAAKTLPEFIAYVKANPGRINMASAGIDMTHIPYRGGGPAIVNLLGGQVDVFFSPMAIAVAHIRAGKLRALATTGAARSDALPEIPTVSEFVPGFETNYWIGLGAPKSTPAEIIGKLNREINMALADPGLRSRFTDLGGSVVGGSPDEFAKLVSDETDKWSRVVRAAHIKAE